MTVSTGLVEPAFRTVPPYTKTLGPVVAEVAEMAGYAPDGEQREALDAIFGMDAANRVVALEVAVIACRQNLKTALFKQCALGWLFVTDQRLIVWSAHEFSTAQEAHRDLAELIDGCPQLRRRLKRVHHGAADKSIEMLSGQRAMFKARTHTGGRGLSGDKIVLDEAFALQDVHIGALFPTLSARPDPQLVYGSSAGLQQSGVLRALRDRGRRGDPRLAYIEFTDDMGGDCAFPGCDHAPVREGCRLDDERRWFRANPALGRRITLEYVRAERRGMPPMEFARERLGWWDDPVDMSGHVFPPDSWDRCRDASAAPDDGLVFAVDVKSDRSMAAIGVAGHGVSAPVVEMLGYRAGTGWVVSELLRLQQRWGGDVLLDAEGPAGSLVAELQSAGVSFQILSARKCAQACGGFFDAVSGDPPTVLHRGQPELDAAVRGARAKQLADAWVLSRRMSEVDVSPLNACIFALSGLAQAAPRGDFLVVR